MGAIVPAEFAEPTINTLRAQLATVSGDLQREQERAGRLEADKDELLGQLKRASDEVRKLRDELRVVRGRLEFAMAGCELATRDGGSRPLR